MVAIALGELLAKHVTTPYKLKPVVRPTVSNTVSNKEGAISLKNGDVDIAWSPGSFSYPAYNGIGQYKDVGRVKLRALFFGQPGFLHLLTTDPAIKSVKDFKGKRVACDVLGDNITLISTKAMLDVDGMKDTDIKIMQYKSGGDAFTMLKEGVVDAAIVLSAAPSTGLEEAINSRAIYFIPASDAEIQAIGKAIGPYFVYGKIPANAYKGQTQPITTVLSYTNYMTTPKLDEQLAYSITQAVFENLQEFYSYNANAKYWTLDGATACFLYPYHPGSIKYFKEKGIWTADNEAQQQKLLEEDKKF